MSATAPAATTPDRLDIGTPIVSVATGRSGRVVADLGTRRLWVRYVGDKADTTVSRSDIRPA